MTDLYMARLNLGSRVLVWAIYNPATTKYVKGCSWEEGQDVVHTACDRWSLARDAVNVTRITKLDGSIRPAVWATICTNLRDNYRAANPLGLSR